MSSRTPDPTDLAAPLRLSARVGSRLRPIAIALVALLAFALWWSGAIGSMVEPERVREVVRAAGPAAPLAFILLLIPLNPVLLAGAPIWISSSLFPLPFAIAYSIVGAVVTSAGTYLMSTYFGREWARERVPNRLHTFRDRLEGSPVRTVAMLRMMLWINPGVDLLIAVTRVRFVDYVLGTALGIALPTAARVYVGHVGIEAISGSNNWLWLVLVGLVVAVVGFRLYRKRRPRDLPAMALDTSEGGLEEPPAANS